MSALQWVWSELGSGSWLYGHMFALWGTPNNSAHILTSFNIFLLQLVQVEFCPLQSSKGTGGSEKEITGGGGSAYEQPELLRVRM